MESNFREWLTFFVSNGTAINYYRDVKDLFENHHLTLKDFESSSSLQEYIRKIITKNRYTKEVLPKRNSLSNESGSDSDSDSEIDLDSKKNAQNISRVQNLRGNTIVRKLYALKFYAKFLGQVYSSIDILTKQMSKRSANQLECQFLQQYYEYNITSNILHGVLACLRENQKLIDKNIVNILNSHHIGNVSDESFEFGKNHLRPFLEICIRLFVIPLDIPLIRNLVFYRKIIPTNETYPEIDTIVTLNTPILFIDSSSGIHLAYRIRDNMKNSSRIVNTPLPENIAFYMFFYIMYCRNEFMKVVIRTRTSIYIQYNGNFLFIDSKNGRQWQRVVRDIRIYSRSIGINVDWLSLIPGHNYVYTSKLLWTFLNMFRMEKPGVLDVETLSHYTYVTGISIATGQANSYYHAFQHMTKNKQSLDFLGYSTPLMMESTYSISNIAPDIQKQLSTHIKSFTSTKLNHLF